MSLPAFYLPLCLTFIVPEFHLSCRSTTLLQPFLNTLQFANFLAPGHLDAGVHVEGGGDSRAIQNSRDEKAAFREVHFKLRNPKMGITLTARIWLGLASFDLLVPSHHCRTKPLKHNLSAIVEQTTTFPPTTIRPFCQTLSVERDLLDLIFWALLLDMIFLGTHQLRGGVYVF